MGSDNTPNRFFVLLRGEFDSAYDTEMLEADPVNLGKAPGCERCGRFIGTRRWLSPRRVDLTLHGSTWGDFAFRGAAGEDFLLSERAARLYRASGMTGLSGFEPVEIARVRGNDQPAPRYLYVAVDHGGAAVDEERSSLVRSEQVACEHCHYGGILSAVHGFRLSPETWTGQDVFVPRGLPGTAVVTSRFRDWVESHRLTNVRLTPTEDYEWDSMAPISGSR